MDRVVAVVDAYVAADRLRCDAECHRRDGFLLRPPGCPFPSDLLHRRPPCDDGHAVDDAATGGGGDDDDEKGDQEDREYRSHASNFPPKKEINSI